MRQHKVFKLHALVHGKIGNREAHFAHQLCAHRDVPHQIALHRIFRRHAVRQLLQFADVVQNRAGDKQIVVGVIRRGEELHALDDLEDVFEQTAAIGVVHRLRCGPDAQPIAIHGHHTCHQFVDEWRLDGADVSLQLLPHLVERSGRTGNAVFLTEPVECVAQCVHTTDFVEHQFEFLVEEIAARLDLDELARLKFLAHGVHVLKHLGFDFAGGVLQDDREIRAALARAHFLACAQKKSPAGGGTVEIRNPWKCRHYFCSGTKPKVPRPSHAPPSIVMMSPVM